MSKAGQREYLTTKHGSSFPGRTQFHNGTYGVSSGAYDGHLNHHLGQAFKCFLDAITGFGTRLDERPTLGCDHVFIDLP